jgi:hypothetical protein
MPGYPKDAMYTYAMRMALLGFPIMQALDDGYVLYSQCQHKKGDSSHLTQPLTRSLLCVTFSSSFAETLVTGEELRH